MAVTLHDVEHIARLARLTLTENEKGALVSELNDILGYMEQLNTLDTTTVEPLSHVIDLPNEFREDVLRPGLTREEALRNAPSSTEEFFKVPKVIADR